MWRVAFRDTLASGLAMAVVARAVAVGERALARLPCGLWLAKMERISEVLQCPVIVEGRGPRVLEPQLLEKLDFLRGRGAAEGRILKEFLEPRLFADGLFGFPLDKLESFRLPWDDAVV